MKQDRIISALVGLVGACSNNPKTENTDCIVIKALAFPIIYKELNEKNLSEIINEIYSEKHKIAPNCASCTMPCGSTSDYDMSRIYEAEDKIRDIKLELILKCENLAAHIYSDKLKKENLQKKNLNKEDFEKESFQINYEIFYKVLAYISFDIGIDSLTELLKEIENIESNIIF